MCDPELVAPADLCLIVSMAQMINRVRGKTQEQRRRDRGREVKANKRAAGKATKSTPKLSKATPLSRRQGAGKLPAMTKKKIRMREKRARNVCLLFPPPHSLPLLLGGCIQSS